MEVTDEALRRVYSEYSDEALLEAIALGPASYSAQAWRVLQGALTHRGLDVTTSVTSSDPASSTPREGRATAAAEDDPASSPQAPPVPPSWPLRPAHFFIWSRLKAGTRWPPEEPLPLSGLYWLGATAWIGGALFLLLGILGMLGPGSAAGTQLDAVPTLVFAAWQLAFAKSTDHGRTPRTWWAAVIYVALTVPFATAVFFPTVTPRITIWEIGALPTWLLYFVRRRAMYGLPPWRWAL